MSRGPISHGWLTDLRDGTRLGVSVLDTPRTLTCGGRFQRTGRTSRTDLRIRGLRLVCLGGPAWRPGRRWRGCPRSRGVGVVGASKVLTGIARRRSR